MDFFFLVLLGQEIIFLHSHRCCLTVTGMGAESLHQNIMQGLVGVLWKEASSLVVFSQIM